MEIKESNQEIGLTITTAKETIELNLAQPLL